MDRLRQMHIFTLVAKNGSLVSAARTLEVTPAAISKQLTRLEEDLGVILLERNTRNVQLTHIGTQYLHQCERVLEEAREADAIAMGEITAPKGPLKILSGRYFAATYLMPNLKKFLELYPDIRVEIEITARIPNLIREGIDVLIGMAKPAPDYCVQKSVIDTRHVICASPDYLKKFGTPKTLNDLKNHRYIHQTMLGPRNELPIKGGKVFKVDPYMVISDGPTIADLAAQGIGYTLLPHAFAAKQLEDGSLVEVLGEFLEPSIPIYVAYPERRHVPSTVRCFVEFMTEICKDAQL